MEICRRALFRLAVGGVAGVAVKAESRMRVVRTRVFAAGKNGGSLCPVVAGADAVPESAMRELARKFGVEAVSIVRPQDKSADIRIRYFVPDHEMGVSGHATIAAVTVALMGKTTRRNPVRIETMSGMFEAAWEKRAEGYRVTLAQNAPVFGAVVAADRVAKVLGIATNGIAAESPVQSVSVSRAKLLVPVRNSQILNAMKPDFEALWRLCDEEKVSGLYPFTRHSEQANMNAEARQFPLRAGFPEDAATGVAAAALAPYLVHYDLANRPGHHEFRFAQGYAMGAPSLIEATADCSADGAITGTAIRGSAQILDTVDIAVPLDHH